MLKNHIMISEYKCPDFPFNTIVDELGTKKIFFKSNNAKLIFSDGESYDISNVELYVLDDIKVDFEINQRFINDYGQFDIEFESSDGWLVIIENCYFTYFHNMVPVSAEGLKVIITMGSYNNETQVRYYEFIENLNLTKECEITVKGMSGGRFETTEEMGVQKHNQQACRSIRINCIYTGTVLL